MLTSAAASTQTTILPTARTTLSMARAGRDARARSAHVHPRYLTPHVSTILMGVLSIVWYVGLTIVSENILFDSIAALGLMIAFYYGLTGFACTIYYRRELLTSVEDVLAHRRRRRRSAALMLAGVFVKSCYRPLQARRTPSPATRGSGSARRWSSGSASCSSASCSCSSGASSHRRVLPPQARGRRPGARSGRAPRASC